MRTACLAATLLGLLLHTSASTAAPLSTAEQQLLRDAAAGRVRSSAADIRLINEAMALARREGERGNLDAIPALLASGDRGFVWAFSETNRQPPTPAIEAVVVQHLRSPALGLCSAAPLLREYRQRETFDALLAASRASGGNNVGDNREMCERAMVRTPLTGIEAELTAHLPRVTEWYAQNAIAEWLLKRRHAPAETALLRLLDDTPVARGLSTRAALVAQLASPAVPDALARTVARMRAASPDREIDSELAGILVSLVRAVPRTPLNRSLLSTQVLEGFPAPRRERIVAALREREAIERRTTELNAANLAWWIGQRMNAEVTDFIRRGIDVNAQDPATRDWPLHVAAKYGNWEALQLLLDAGARPDVQDADGQTALRIVARNRPPAPDLEAPVLNAARLLIARGANPSLAPRDGMGPLHLAAAFNYRSMAAVLVEGGADVNAEAIELGITGLRPTQIADDHKYTELAAYLRSRGGSTSAAFLARRTAQQAATRILAPLLISH